MSHFDDPFDASKFPGRPDHPDFWKLSEIALRIDGRAVEGRVRMPDQIREHVDPDCLIYLAKCRAAFALREVIPSGALRNLLLPLATALIIDGFAIGVTLEKERER